ncbi:hypothetical protein DH2020_044060 [Rehmannia glutinosa]|uniref:SHSP domain-containing protein n=1 Tax=Rehmannia glutinosa TaxID=99300 RepID=A0ABR0UIC7_REHGL
MPFHSDADVLISKTHDSLRFTAATNDISGDELDLWHFKLPNLMRLELASATYKGSELVVTIPKKVAKMEEVDVGPYEDDIEDIGGGRLFLVL